MMSKRNVEVEISWEAPSGVKYPLLVNVTMVTDAHYGADADGNRGTCVEFIDEYTLACTPEELKTIITDLEDFSYFDSDFISEEVEEAISNLCD